MTSIEIVSTENCRLCEDAKELLHHLKADFEFEIKERVLQPGDEEFPAYQDSFPVILAPNGRKIQGKVTEEGLRDLLTSLAPPPPLYYAAKFLEALGIVALFFGFMYGLMGNMWIDLYFFLGGLVIFLAGWALEKWEKQRRRNHRRAR